MAITTISRHALGIAWDVGGNGKTVIRAGGGIFFEQGSYDSFMAIGNLLGLRTVPTGVNLYTNGNPTPSTAGGTSMWAPHLYRQRSGIANHAGNHQV